MSLPADLFEEIALTDYFIRFRGRVEGPLQASDVISRWKSGRISALHDCSTDGSTWIPLSRLQVVTDESGEETIVERAEASRQRAAAQIVSQAPIQPPPIPHAAAEPEVPPRRRATRDYADSERIDTSSNNGMAIAGFVCSLVGLFIGPVAVLGLILSAIGLGRPAHRGLAIAGLVIGIIGSLAWIAVLLLISAGNH